MNNLKVVEEGLIKVYETDKQEQVVNARELYEGLGSKRKFADWVKNRLNECDALENQDYTSLSQKCEGNNATKIEYILKLDIAKEMAMLERNEIGKNFRRYFIEVEKKYKQKQIDVSKLSPELQMFNKIFNTLATTQMQQQELENKIIATNNKVEGIKEVVAINSTEWKKDTKNLLNKIAQSIGGTGQIHQQIRRESYEYLESRMGCQLKIRLTNKRRRMADEGVCKSKRDKLTKLDVIGEDKKLIEGYVAIVKEMAIKYDVV